MRPSLQCVEACSQEDWEPGTYAAMGPLPISNQDLLVGVGGLGVPEFGLWQVPNEYGYILFISNNIDKKNKYESKFDKRNMLWFEFTRGNRQYYL